MEKSSPHYSLADILAQMQSVADMNLTISAREGIRSAGMSHADAFEVVQALTRKHF